jgi:hypothetical protein
MPGVVTHVPAPSWCTLPAPWISCGICREPPGRDSETATLRWVRQSRRYPLWRVSHSYDPEVAVRLICWFPPDRGTVVVTLFAADKARLGDVFYDGVAARADPLIDQWKRETAQEEEKEE